MRESEENSRREGPEDQQDEAGNKIDRAKDRAGHSGWHGCNGMKEQSRVQRRADTKHMHDEHINQGNFSAHLQPQNVVYFSRKTHDTHNLRIEQFTHCAQVQKEKLGRFFPLQFAFHFEMQCAKFHSDKPQVSKSGIHFEPRRFPCFLSM